MGRRQLDVRAFSKLADVTRSLGVERGFELLLWLVYVHWRSLVEADGSGIHDVTSEELPSRLAEMARLSPWTPAAFHTSEWQGSRDAQAIYQAFVQLDALLHQEMAGGPEPRDAHAAVFEGLLGQIERLGARRWEESSTPPRVAQFMVEACRKPLGHVLDPAAGLGSALLAAHESGATSLSGWDVNDAALGVLRARAEMAGAAAVDLRTLDTLREGSDLPNTWDTVLLAPPWGARPRDQADLGWLPIKARGSLDLVWALSADRLRGRGQAVLHLPIGALTRAAEQEARRYLLKHVESVIALPAGAGAGTGVRSALVLLAPQQSEDVLMLTAEDAASGHRHELEWNQAVLSDVIGRLHGWRDGAPAHDVEETGRAKVVPRLALRRDAILHPTRYAGTPAAVEALRPDPPGRLITRIAVESFKSFGPAIEAAFAPITLIYGPNASGKSSVIQSLLLQKQSLEAGGLTLSGTFAGLGSFAGLVHRHQESRTIAVGFEFAVPERWEIAREALSPAVPRALRLNFSADATGAATLHRILLGAAEHLFAFHVDSEDGGGGWRLPVDQAVRLVEMVVDPDMIWQGDPGKKPLSSRRVADVRRILNLAHSEDGGVPAGASGLLPDRIDLEFAPYAQGTTIEPADLAATSLRRSFSLLNGARADLERALRELSYLGPIRSAPERTYVRGAVSRHRILDPEGGDAANVLFDSPSEAQVVSDWLDRMKVPYGVTVYGLQTKHPGVGDLLHMELLDRRFDPPVAVSPADVGFGVSQLLPLVVQLLVARDQVVCIEQPEIHLHPRLQAEFAELLIESTSAEGRANQVIVETHSEHLMLRLQRKIRAGEITPDDLAVLYVDIDPACQTAEIKRLRLDERGRFVDRWPGGFFDERFEEIFDPEALPKLPSFLDDEDDAQL